METKNLEIGTRVEILTGINKGLSGRIEEILTEANGSELLHGFDYLVNVYGEPAYYYENEIKVIR